MARLSSVFILLIISLLGHGIIKLEASHHLHKNLVSHESTFTNATSQPYRTGYHFQPPMNWINDPNGPMIYKGIYHLFYQYNPKGAVWGNIVWAHSTSTDLINWTPHDPAIYPSQPSDINGCWSGSATILPGDKPVIFYTGIDPQKKQVQNMAVPKNLSDPYLIDWVKYSKNPLMEPTWENQINASSFRDPTTAWFGPDKRWRLIVGSKRHRRGLAILYRSKDFVHWNKSQHPLHSAKDTGMWECPDFFPVSFSGQDGVDTSVMGPDVKHVLKVSLDDTKHEYYTIGTYNSVKDSYIPDKGSVESDAGLRYDYGKFYASKTFFDGDKKRRILWGWINESSSVGDDIAKGWSGLQAIPRHIWLDRSGKQLVQWPIKEIEKLRQGPVNLNNQVLKGGGSVVEVSGVTAVQVDVEVSFELSHIEKAEKMDPSWTNPQLLCSQKGASAKGSFGPFGLLVLASKGMQEYTAVFFRVFQDQNNKYVVLMCSDQSRSSLNEENDKTTYGAFVDVDPVHEKLSLRSLIDHSIVESFGGEGKACITARVYPTLATGGGARLYAFNNGTQSVTINSLSAWTMKKAQIN
ncbi:Glycosyl hydrolases family 32 protein isoform 1 [Tripterygium wilfordii]|uniref:Glycosyl hydrolases family 32 protein isoform 1 n=1 Tax=Tripterygium wilfordii TaxID=458696 RepID=A0A7J7DGL8_TRIWF|nr:beta-fructofuranosidase, insoluble isoenzyme CWINV1-like [Tripterygium wilfordii]KAF5745520.1 Glycosyl hydrolases family 32 protein isoform 1 [Tripterygium wilfordii]